MEAEQIEESEGGGLSCRSWPLREKRRRLGTGGTVVPLS